MSSIIHPSQTDLDFCGNLDVLSVPPKVRLTEDEFVVWCGDKTRAEWVDGEVIVMSPSSIRHGKILQFLLRVFGEFVEEQGLGDVYLIEIQVRFDKLRQRRMPDLFFVSKDRAHIVQKAHVEGAPNLIVEVVSPDSVDRDWKEKLDDYRAAGVDEYWIIDPLSERLEAYQLDAKKKNYQRIREVKGRVNSKVLPGLFIKPEWLWADELPRARDVLREFGIG